MSQLACASDRGKEVKMDNLTEERRVNDCLLKKLSRVDVCVWNTQNRFRCLGHRVASRINVQSQALN
jgi:hypothetical protein